VTPTIGTSWHVPTYEPDTVEQIKYWEKSVTSPTKRTKLQAPSTRGSSPDPPNESSYIQHHRQPIHQHHPISTPSPSTTPKRPCSTKNSTPSSSTFIELLPANTMHLQPAQHQSSITVISSPPVTSSPTTAAAASFLVTKTTTPLQDTSYLPISSQQAYQRPVKSAFLPTTLTAIHRNYWESDTVIQWLETIKLGTHKNTFVAEEIKGWHLDHLSSDNLEGLGLKKLGHRITFKHELNRLQVLQDN